MGAPKKLLAPAEPDPTADLKVDDVRYELEKAIGDIDALAQDLSVEHLILYSALGHVETAVRVLRREYRAAEKRRVPPVRPERR